MDTNVNYTLVGAFVILIVTSIVITIIWLSSGLSVTSYSNYIIYSQESVSGLSIDAPVEYNGVTVGSVKSIELDKANLHLVKVLLNIKSSTPITMGTVGTLTSRGITGVAYIALKDIGRDSRPLIPPTGEPYPVIPTSPSIFMRLDTALTKLSKNFEAIANAVNALLDQDNLTSIKDTLAHLNKVSASLADNSDKINMILQNTSKASQQLTPLLHSSASAIKAFEEQTLPSTSRLMLNLNDIAKTLNDVANQLKQNPSILIRGTAPAPLGPGERK